MTGRLCFNEFTWWDDSLTVHQNPLLNPAHLATIRYYWLHSAYRIYTPLTYTIWAALTPIARVAPDPDGITLDPLIYHSANVLFHVLAALVVFKILRLLQMDRPAAFCGALVFAIHPIQVEAVAWISGLKDVLGGFFALIALWQYLRFAIAARDGNRRVVPVLLCVAAFILALLSKASAGTMPLAAIAIDRWILGRPWRSILPMPCLLVLIAVPFVIAASIAQGGGDLGPIPIWQRPLIASDSLTFYCRKLVCPIDLCIDYGRAPQVVTRSPWIYVSFAFASAIIAASIAMRNRAPSLFTGAMVFAAATLPGLGLTTFIMQFFSTTADHYLYWAMLGPAIAVAGVLTARPNSLALRLGVAAAISAMAILSIRQGAFWKDDISLERHAVAVNPNSFLAWNNLGNAYYRQQDAPLAAEMFRHAITAKPDYAIAHSNLAAALHQLGELTESNDELRHSIALQRSLAPRLRTSLVTDLNHLAQNLLDARQYRSMDRTSTTATSTPAQ